MPHGLGPTSAEAGCRLRSSVSQVQLTEAEQETDDPLSLVLSPDSDFPASAMEAISRAVAKLILHSLGCISIQILDSSPRP